MMSSTVEILRTAQKLLMTGRELDLSPDTLLETPAEELGEVSDIEVSRYLTLESLEEISDLFSPLFKAVRDKSNKGSTKAQTGLFRYLKPVKPVEKFSQFSYEEKSSAAARPMLTWA